MPFAVLANEPIQEENWGVGIGIRSASMPFKTNGNTVNDVVPLLFYQGDNVYLEGASGGIHFYQSDTFSLGFAAGLRFFDIPRYAQNTIQGSQIDVGGRVTWHYSPKLDISLDLMSDNDGRIYSNLTTDYRIDGEGWDVSLYATLRLNLHVLMIHITACRWRILVPP
ncbi:hypothetical protein JCM19231_1867 [Vibrio ishigakensis]|uniref:Outer membrane protein beta-barrel domain-containing protein n=1 Tax=Vibrio ishigakensis TaxID=1481914 RepID=A0A0B8NSN2_9VIBR|nr:hypothetical protein JCM19231_1867 [Vibrio ishigakensis]